MGRAFTAAHAMAVQDPASQHRISIASGTGPNSPSLPLPFVIGVLGDFSGTPEKPLPNLRYRRFVDVDLNNLDDVLQACAPRLTLAVQNKLSDDPDASILNVELRFRNFADLSPDVVARQIKPLGALLELREKLASLRESVVKKDGLDEFLQKTLNDEEKLKQLRREVTGESEPSPLGRQPDVESQRVLQSAGPARRNWKDSVATPAPQFEPSPVQTAALSRKNWKEDSAPEPGVWSKAREAESTSILDQLVEVRRSITQADKERTRDNLKYFITDLARGNMTASEDTEVMINGRIAQIDHLVSEQLNEVLHHRDFQRLEACWRGLHFLLRHVRKAPKVKVRILNISKKELLCQFQRERERHTSPVARKLLDNSACMAGVMPFSLLIGDFEVGRSPEDAELMDKLARLCSYVHAPFLAAASPGLLGFDSFTQCLDAEQLRGAFESPEYSMWNSFRARTESRYIGIVLPGMLMRLPFGRASHPIDAFDFEEGVDGTGHRKFLWGSGAWALAARFALDVDRYAGVAFLANLVMVAKFQAFRFCDSEPMMVISILKDLQK